MNKKPLLLMILDGWGISSDSNDKNAILKANPKNFNHFFSSYPHTFLDASGEFVGLPEGQMGNSEVGHLNLGAGRIVYQPLAKISKDIKDGVFFQKESILNAFNLAKKKNVSLHLLGLLSDGGVHSHTEHMFALLDMAKITGLTNVFIHAFIDGRDTPPKSGLEYIEKLENKIKEIGIGSIASISGRFYAMDRDSNWDRIEQTYNVMTGNCESSNISAKDYLLNSYSRDVTDEFLKPVLLDKNGIIKNGDVLINFNYRPDRAREITRAFTDTDFSEFKRDFLAPEYFCMRQYDSTIDANILYIDEDITNTLGEIISKNNLTQLRAAETEKYAHVTFFFNGGVEEKFKGEERILIPSPKVKTYDLKPEMSASELTNSILTALDKNEFDVVIMNFANPDMVGHTGNFEAAIKAINTVDDSLGKIVNKVLSLDGTALVTADHGNAEKMFDSVNNLPFTAHTTNKVPFIYISNSYNGKLIDNGKLSDIAPTMLEILNIEKPSDMSGVSLKKGN